MALRTGEVARTAGVNVETLRFYERQGLLPEPPRRASGYREYPPETVDLIRFVKRAQGVGFSLREIRELLALRGGTRRTPEKVRRLVKSKLADVENRLRDLQAMQQALNGLLRSCEAEAGPAACPIIESLGECPDYGQDPAAPRS